MATRTIVKYGHPALRIKAQPVGEIDDDIHKLVGDMIDTMRDAEGIGLAAPQVAESVAVCVVDLALIEEGAPPKAYVNPEVLQESGSFSMEEGCLSIPEIREDVIRPETVRVRYRDLSGEEHEETLSGMLARVLQHEIDHLNGILFIDKISPIKRKLLSKRLRKLSEESRLEVKSTGKVPKGAL